MTPTALLRLLLALASCAPLASWADWTYETSRDQMTSKETRIAELESNNSLSLDFPYKGANRGTIQVRQHAKYGLDVIVYVEQGQMLCHSYGDCHVEIRFDDAPAVRFSGNPPNDHSSTAIFLQDRKRFIAAASKAKRILVQVLFFRNGAQVLEFSTSKPLEWASSTGAGAAKKKPAS